MVSVIIPFYNCEKTVNETMRKIEEFKKGNNMSFELIVVNDGSTDNTAKILSQYISDDIRFVGYEKNRGKGGALREGVMAASGDKIIFTDADLAYGLKHLKEFCIALDDSKIVIGTRREDKNINDSYGIRRNAFSRMFSCLVQILLGLDIVDTQCGFKGYQKETAKELFNDLEIYGFGFDLEILAKAKAKNISIKQLPVIMENNSKGSNVNIMADGIKMIFDMFKIRKMIRKLHK